MPIYLAAVPFDLVVPFDAEYHPELTRDGKASIDSIYQQWSEGKARGMFLYQSIDRFVVSDDYLVYFSCVKGQPDHVPAWILGKPDHPRVKELYGPFDMRDAEKLDLDEILRRTTNN